MHLSQLKKSQPVYRTLLVPEECAPDEFQAPIDNSEPLELTPTQKSRLDTILGQFPDVFTNKPGSTSLVKHSISVNLPTPIWSPSYSIPLSYQEPFRLEIENMLELALLSPQFRNGPALPSRSRRRMEAFVLSSILGLTR